MTKTNEQYINDVRIVNNNIDVLGTYIGARIPIQHKCSCGNNDWYPYPYNVLNGQNCALCKNDKIILAITKSHKQYLEEVYTINPNIIVMEEYKGALTSIRHTCECGNDNWMVAPSNVLRGVTCRKCFVVRNSITHEDYVNRIGLINPKIKVLDKYTNSYTPIKHQCECGNDDWYPRPHGVLNGNLCRVCSYLKQRKTHDTYVYQVKLINSNIEILGEYIDYDTHIQHKCECGNDQWYPTPMTVLNGSVCKKCTVNRRTKSNEDYIEEVKYINKNIEVIGDYVNINIPIQHKCECGNTDWYPFPKSVLKGGKCRLCCESKGSKRVREWLINNNIIFDVEYDKFNNLIGIGGRPLRFDFVIFEDTTKQKINLLIEYDGEFHFKKIYEDDNFEILKHHDELKNGYCISNNIDLLRIPYWEFDNIESILEMSIIK